jgi:hypothetical protein
MTLSYNTQNNEFYYETQNIDIEHNHTQHDNTQNYGFNCDTLNFNI